MHTESTWKHIHVICSYFTIKLRASQPCQENSMMLHVRLLLIVLYKHTCTCTQLGIHVYTCTFYMYKKCKFIMYSIPRSFLQPNDLASVVHLLEHKP